MKSQPDEIKKLKNQIKKLEIRVNNLENKKHHIQNSDDFEQKIMDKIDDIGIQHLILLSLKLESKQSRKDLQLKLENWKKPVGKWFQGGNFSTRLLKPNLLLNDGKNTTNEELFSLGRSGVKTVKELIKKYDL